MSNNNFKIGNNAALDEGVSLGYPPQVQEPVSPLTIGDNARLRSGTVIYAGTSIGNGLQTGHNAVIRENNKIGDNFSLWSNSVIDYGCKIGNNVKIHTNCYIAQFTTIEDEVFFAPGVTIANDFHPGCEHSKKCMKGPTIKKGAVLGGNVTVLPHVTIGENSLIGAGSVVTKDIPADSVACGNPAKVLKSIYELKCKTGITDRPYKKGD